MIWLTLLACLGAPQSEAPLRLLGEAAPLERARVDGAFARLAVNAPVAAGADADADCAIEGAPGPGRVAVAALGAPGLLTCTQETLDSRSEALIGLLTIYAARTDYERALPVRERRRMDPGEGPPPEAGLAAPPGGESPLVQAALTRAATLPRPYPAGAHRVIEGSASARLIAVTDSDGDGLLSHEEFRGATRFQDPLEYDLDADGYVDEAEVRAMLLTLSPLLISHRGFGKLSNEKQINDSKAEFDHRIRNLIQRRSE